MVKNYFPQRRVWSSMMNPSTGYAMRNESSERQPFRTTQRRLMNTASLLVGYASRFFSRQSTLCLPVKTMATDLPKPSPTISGQEHTLHQPCVTFAWTKRGWQFQYPARPFDQT